MNFLTIKEYARKYKLSIFQTVKLAKSGKVETVTKTINGKEQTFIKDTPLQENHKPQNAVPTILELQKEIEQLKKEIKNLKDCCKKVNT